MTGKEILQAEFEKAGMRGYRADQVDALLQSIASFVDKQKKENDDLTYKMKILADKIEEYKKDEESIRDALLGAQKMGSSILNEAKSKAEALTRESRAAAEEMLTSAQQKSEAMVSSAKTASEEMLAQAKSKIENLTKDSLQKANLEIANARREGEREKKKLEAMKNEISSFRSSILKQYKAHLDLLSNLPVEEIKERDAHEMPQQASANKSDDSENSRTASPSEDVSQPEKGQKSNLAPAEQVLEKEENSKISKIPITHSQTIKSDITAGANSGDDDSELKSFEKEQTKEFGKRISVSVLGNEADQDKQEDDSKNESDKDSHKNDFIARSRRTSFAEKFGELDFGNNNNK